MKKKPNTIIKREHISITENNGVYNFTISAYPPGSGPGKLRVSFNTHTGKIIGKDRDTLIFVHTFVLPVLYSYGLLALTNPDGQTHHISNVEDFLSIENMLGEAIERATMFIGIAGIFGELIKGKRLKIEDFVATSKDLANSFDVAYKTKYKAEQEQRRGGENS